MRAGSSGEHSRVVTRTGVDDDELVLGRLVRERIQELRQHPGGVPGWYHNRDHGARLGCPYAGAGRDLALVRLIADRTPSRVDAVGSELVLRAAAVPHLHCELFHDILPPLEIHWRVAVARLTRNTSNMRIGLIVPVRPPAPFLDEALRSALGQDPPDERAVVEDEQGQGAPSTREAALARLSPDCDWITLLDADDVWEPGKLAAQREAIARHPDAVLCFGQATTIDEHGRPTGERMPEPAPGAHTAADFAPVLYESNPIPTSSVLVRRDALVDAGGFPGPVPAADWDLWLRLVADGGSFVCEPRARIRYRRHAGGVTADVAALAEARMKVHAAHATLVDEESRRRAESRDLVLLARGRIRQRRYGEAAEALARADALEPLQGRERVLRRLVGVPLARGVLGRRTPYR